LYNKQENKDELQQIFASSDDDRLQTQFAPLALRWSLNDVTDHYVLFAQSMRIKYIEDGVLSARITVFKNEEDCNETLSGSLYCDPLVTYHFRSQYFCPIEHILHMKAKYSIHFLKERLLSIASEYYAGFQPKNFGI
jgi:hypothetical protein